MSQCNGIGVVIPAFNARGFIATTIKSLQSQTLSDWLCVVIDDGSTDDTGAIADEFARFDSRIRVLRQPNSGVSAARMSGASLVSNQKFLLFLDADDVLLNSALEHLTDALAERPDAVGSSGWAEICDADGNVVGGEHPPVQRARLTITKTRRLKQVAPDADLDFAMLSVWGPLWPPCTVLIRTADFLSCGGFLPGVGTQEDWECFLRLSRRGPFVSIDSQVALYRRHAANRSLDDATLGQWRDAVRERTMSDPVTTPRQRQILRTSVRALEVRGAVTLIAYAAKLLTERHWGEARASMSAASLLSRRAIARQWATTVTSHPLTPLALEAMDRPVGKAITRMRCANLSVAP